jgi:hypothetical protein
MNIEIRVRGVRLTKAERAQVKLTLGLALGGFAAQLGRVVVSIQHGGLATAPKDILCRVDVEVPPRKVQIDEIDSHMPLAVNRATHRASRSIARALQLQRRVEGRRR